MAVEIYQNQELPDWGVEWPDREGVAVNFSSGYTFELRLVRGGAVKLDKTTGITGSASFPNLTVVWDLGEMDDIDPGVHDCVIVATRTADGKHRTKNGTVVIKRLVT